MGWMHNPYKQDTSFQDANDAAYDKASVWLKFEMENNDGVVQRFTPHVPTDWSKTPKAEADHLMGGYDLANGTCEKCFMVRAANGECTGCGA